MMTQEQRRELCAAIREGQRFNIYARPRRQMEELWALLMGKPMKFPARRRRSDREVPAKAA